MNIGYICWGHIDTIIPLINYIVKLDNHKVSVYLLFNQKYKSESIINFQNIEVKNGFLNDEIVRKILGEKVYNIIGSSINVKIFILNSPKPYDIKNFILYYRLCRRIVEQKFDIINLNGCNIFESIVHFFLRKFPRIHTIHDPAPHSGEGGKLTHKRLEILSKIDTDFILHANKMSKLFQNTFEVPPEKIHTVYYGSLDVYKIFLSSKTRENEPIVLFYGRIVKYKGIEYLIEAMKIVKQKVENVKLIIAGSGSFYFDIEDIKVDRSIMIINKYIPNEQLCELIYKSDIVVCPYIDATQSGVVLTAFAFDKPVLATNVGGIPEVIKHNYTGFIVPPKDPEALANSLIYYFSNPLLKNIMKENIQKIKIFGELSWNSIAEKTLQIYRNKIESIKK